MDLSIRTHFDSGSFSQEPSQSVSAKRISSTLGFLLNEASKRRHHEYILNEFRINSTSGMSLIPSVLDCDFALSIGTDVYPLPAMGGMLNSPCSLVIGAKTSRLTILHQFFIFKATASSLASRELLSAASVRYPSIRFSISSREARFFSILSMRSFSLFATAGSALAVVLAGADAETTSFDWGCSGAATVDPKRTGGTIAAS
mmetsp:Transcript_7535/g.16719  ORF Transcript_7535/g.16719 Transcript_7535/m.16719 type:complete len:202 (+) Transcript_7535:351-956(+)